METTVFQIELKDGRIFRVFCANSTQKKKVIESHFKIEDKVKDIKVIANGIHNIKEYMKHLQTF